jgi:hypothetical protein
MWIKLLYSIKVMHAVMSTQTVYPIITHSGAEVTSSYTHRGHVTPFIGQGVVPSTWKYVLTSLVEMASKIKTMTKQTNSVAFSP